MPEFEIIELDECLCLTKSGTCRHAELPDTISRLYGEIMESDPEATMADAPRLYYTRWDLGDCDITAAVPVEPGATGRSGVELTTFPACKALCVTHIGPYEGLHESWTLLWAEMQRRGLQPGGHPWDRYVTDPAEEPNPANWITELNIPLA